MMNRMDTERWARIDELFHAACERPASERAAFLDEACGDDAELRRLVDELLALDDKVGDAVGEAVRGAAAGFDADGGAMLGSRIGPFRVVRQLGRGGMGTVYFAERDDGAFDQQVALKVIRRGLDTDETLARFRRERQILARLEHPNIARLLDGGVTSDGRPYFAMEYVDGEPIDTYCEREGLGVDERLALFLDVCEAVRHAHNALFVHRDLKPGNVMVSRTGEVRLLDFGIAKLVAGDEDGVDATLLTRDDRQRLTPAYAAPEQLLGGAITMATDVYALGVLLYELLTGTRPHPAMGGDLSDRARLLTETEPLRPSVRVAQSTDSDTSGPTTDGTHTDPRKLSRRLRGDIDVICLKALRPEPERRYTTVAELVEDIRRHRQGLPILARPDAVGYRLRKALVRHRVALSAAGAVVLTIAALIGFYTFQLAEERDAARREAAKAERVAGFLKDMFRVADPNESRGETVTARELLDLGAERLDEALADEPAVQATMLGVVGEVYSSLGLAASALPVLERAVELAPALEDSAEGRVEASTLRHALAIAYQDLGRVDEAAPMFEQALMQRQAELAPGDPLVREALLSLGFLHETNGEFEESEARYREAVAAGGSLEDPYHLDAMVKLAGLLRQLDRPEEAEPLLREALAAQREIYGDEDLAVAQTMRQLGGLMRDLGEYEESRDLLEHVLAVRQKVLGPLHPEVAVTLNSLAILAQREGDLETARQRLEEMIATLEEIHDEPHPMAAAARHNLGMAFKAAERYDEAAEQFEQSLGVLDVVVGPDHPNRAYPLVSLGDLRRQQGRLDESERLLRDALRIRTAALPPDHRYVGEAKGNLGLCLVEAGQLQEGERLLLEGYEIHRDSLGVDDRRTERLRRRIFEHFTSTGRLELADAYAPPRSEDPSVDETAADAAQATVDPGGANSPLKTLVPREWDLRPSTRNVLATARKAMSCPTPDARRGQLDERLVRDVASRRAVRRRAVSHRRDREAVASISPSGSQLKPPALPGDTYRDVAGRRAVCRRAVRRRPVRPAQSGPAQSGPSQARSIASSSEPSKNRSAPASPAVSSARTSVRSIASRAASRATPAPLTRSTSAISRSR